jgi:hypothetical protein
MSIPSYKLKSFCKRNPREIFHNDEIGVYGSQKYRINQIL